MLFWGAILFLTALALKTNGAPAVGTRPGCETSPAMVGGTGSMTFHFRQDLNMSSDIFHAYVIRSGDTANVLQCDRRNEAGISCETINQAFEHTTIVNHSLTLQALNVTPDLAGNYTLWTIVGGSKELPAECNFVVRSKREGTFDDKTNINIVPIVVPIVFILLAVATAAAIYIVIIRRKKRRKFGSEKQHPLDDIDHAQKSDLSDDNAATSMLISDDTITLSSDYADKRWYFGNMSPEDEADLPHFKRRNKPGSFLIREQSPYFILAVCGEDRENKRFRIDKEDSYKIEGTAESFESLLKLVEYYRKHDIVLDSTPLGKLGKPFEAEPNEDWYAGKLSRRAEKRLFRSTGNEPSSFLIRECITIPGHYTLAVYINGKTKRKHFLIRVDENTFNFLDAKKTFNSLTELVHYYQANDIVTTKEGNFGRLRTPIRAQTTGCNWI